jgi:RNA polymerase sigma-70 factor, ECF subfamily
VGLSDLERRARLERLFEQHYAAVLAYALRRAPRAVAEDVASETFVVVSRRIEDVPVDTLPWLYGVARRVLANERRGEARRDRLTHELGLNLGPGCVEAAPGDVGRILAVLARLPEPDREALMLTAWEGLSGAEAAAAAGCSGVAMRARLSRARRRLGRLLEGDETMTQASAVWRTPGGASCSMTERSS